MTEIVTYVIIYEKSPFILNVSEVRFDTWHEHQNTSSPTAAGLVIVVLGHVVLDVRCWKWSEWTRPSATALTPN